MIEQKEGIVNEIVYNNTIYNHSQNRYYPTIDGLLRILKEVLESESTTEYIRITPFYINSRRNMHIEFEDSMFYIECRKEYDLINIENHISACLGIDLKKMSFEQKRIGHILYPLCKYTDVKGFQQSIYSYIRYLDELIPKLMKRVNQIENIGDEEYGFGYFCFEIHSC